MRDPFTYSAVGFCIGFIFSSSGLAGFSAGVVAGAFLCNEYRKYENREENDVENGADEEQIIDNQEENKKFLDEIIGYWKRYMKRK